MDVQEADARDVDLLRQKRRQDVFVDELQLDQRGAEALAGLLLLRKGDLHLQLVDEVRSDQHVAEVLAVHHHLMMLPRISYGPGVQASDGAVRLTSAPANHHRVRASSKQLIG